MNPIIEETLAALIAHGTIAVISHLVPEKISTLRKEELLTHFLEKDQKLAVILQKAAAGVAKSAHTGDPRQDEKLKLFLISPDAEAIIRQMFGMNLVRDAKAHSEGILQREFRACLALHLGGKPEATAELADPLFDALVAGCERALAHAIDRGVLSAHEAKSASRHRALLDELDTIKENLRFLNQPTKPNLDEILEFEPRYRQQVAERYGYITPPNFDAARKLPIRNIYVSPSLIEASQNKDGDPITLETFLASMYRAVVLGNPGGGKSTLASKICFDLASGYGSRLLAGRQVTPILVVLRDYGAVKKEAGCSLVQFIERVANSNYQLSPPSSAVEYMLLNGRALLILDGLDELVDTATRREMSADIESFCTIYPSVPVLVTSREVGYEQAPLDHKKFPVYRLAPFHERQAAEYVTKWFAADPDLTEQQRRQKVGAFLAESGAVSDLRSNPLMLALMCNIYRGENYIPRNRPDVYEKCSIMLFERWDKSRGIFLTLPFEAHISPAMKYLAHWIYSGEKLQSGVSERNLVSKSTDYLCEVRFEDRDEAESAARKFIDFCRGRAWVFTDTGTSGEGERLYQFTHRTFLEYFTAAHIVRTNPTPADLLHVLGPRIQRLEWDMVAQLAFQLQNKQIEGAGSQLLSQLLTLASYASEEESTNLLSFGARCLEFIVPPPKLTREITTTCLERTIAPILKRNNTGAKKGVPHATGRELTELVGDCLVATSENLGTVADCFVKWISEKIANSPLAEAELAAEMGLTPAWMIRRRHGQVSISEDKFDFWSKKADLIFENCENQILQLCKKHIGICSQCFLRGHVSVSEIVQWFGHKALFEGGNYAMYPNTFTSSPALTLLFQVLLGGTSIRMKHVWQHRLVGLSEAGQILINLPPPWVRPNESFPLDDEWLFSHFDFDGRPDRIETPLQLDADQSFGCFVLFAATLENAMHGKEPRVNAFYANTKNQLLRRMLGIVLGRLKETTSEMIQKEFDDLGFNRQQQAFAWSWVRGNISLISR